jgi:predicted lipid-binding transport protein (Tim44 family)
MGGGGALMGLSGFSQNSDNVVAGGVAALVSGLALFIGGVVWASAPTFEVRRDEAPKTVTFDPSAMVLRF